MQSLQDRENQKKIWKNLLKNILLILLFILSVFYDATFSINNIPILSSVFFLLLIILNLVKPYLR